MTNERILIMNQPNILILHLDELRQDCLGCYGNPDIQTPNIDTLAADGVTYQNHYTVYPVCTPSRYSLFCSLYVHQHAAWDNHCTLPSGYPTFPKLLRENGYQTTAVGKMHMTPTYLDIGFSDLELAEQNGCGRFEDDYHHFLMKHGKIDRFDLHYESGLFQLPPEDHRFDDCQCCQSDLDLPFYSSEWITQRALDRLDQWNCDQPFCMMVGYISPHHPFDPPAPYSTMYDPNSLHLLPGYTDQPLPFDSNFGSSPIHPDKIDEKDIRAMMASYYGMISEIDNGIGTILQKLKAKGLYDNTMIIFTSDHGDYMSYHHMMLKGRHLYDPLIKIPLIVKYPGQQATGQTDSFLSENIDVAPTVLELCGQPIPPTMQGRSLLGNDHRQFAFSELQFGSQTNQKIGYMLRSDSYKLLVYGSMQDCAFYDLKKDPFELCDVSKEPDYQETLHRYQTALSDFVLFHALGKVHLDTKAPQQRDQEVLNKQAEELKAFIRSQW